MLTRIAQPQSKRAAETLLERFDVEMPLSSIYQMMDRLTLVRIETIKRLAAEAAVGILPHPVDVLFFDCATLYFESFEPDELRQNGYSKDAKFKETQVVLALMVSDQGLPITYELVPGSTWEGSTLTTTLRKLKARFEVREAIVVADRGMLSEVNLKGLEDDEFLHVVGAKLMQLNKAREEELLAWGPEKESVRDFTVNDRRLVASYSLKRAERDRK